MKGFFRIFAASAAMLTASAAISLTSLNLSAQTPEGGISGQMLAEIRKGWQGTPEEKALRNAVTHNGINALAVNNENETARDEHFSDEVPVKGITNQKSSGRCWLFSGLNVLRAKFITEQNLGPFQFSQNYCFFWDQLEKSNLFLQSIIETARKPMDDRRVEWLFSHPIGDGGQFTGVADLVMKYGVVPAEVFPETYSSENTAQMRQLLSWKLKEFGLELRKMADVRYMTADPKANEKIRREIASRLQTRKTEMLSFIYRFLVMNLGEPPTEFDWTLYDVAGNKFETKHYTPQSFYQEYVGRDLKNDYVLLMNDPTRPYYKTYEIDLDRHTYDGGNWLYLNLPMEEIEKMAIASIKGKDAMYFSCDVGKFLDREKGFLDINYYDYGSLMGTVFGMSKADRILTGASASSHAMTLMAVDLDENGAPLKWKVENSWGKKGVNGYLIMTEEWFREYMFRLVVDRKYVPAATLELLKQPPTLLPPWDPMFVEDESAPAGKWSPAGDHIRTGWAEEIDPSAPHPEYPRPQMVRPVWQNLNGLWNYSIVKKDTVMCRPQGNILVPFPVESSLSGVGKTVGDTSELWYERSFTVPNDWNGKDILLHFGAVDWQAEVFVNGQPVGIHKGGYTPFTFDITPFLKKSGKQTLRVKVWDPTDNSYIPRGKQVNSPQGIWYTPVTGIWQTVWLEPVPKTHVESFTPQSDIASGNITFDIKVAGQVEGDVVTVSVLEGKKGYDPETPSQKVIASAVAADGKAVVTVPSPVLWSPENPYLYGVRVSVKRDGKVVDVVNGYTAVRKVSLLEYPTGDRNVNTYKRIALNDKPLFMFGPLDQGWWPDGLYTAPCDEALKFDVAKTKDFGFNMIRKHIKVEPARWYYWCDVLGICVWQDMPCIGDHDWRRPGRDSAVVADNRNHWALDSFLGGTDASVSAEWKMNYYREWEDIIASLKFFPCITVWIPFNEAWGQFDTPQVVKFTRARDTTRLINESSGGNYFFSGDIIDIHHYPCPAMNAFESKFINVLGEYGGIGCPVPGHLWDPDRSWGYNKMKTDGSEVLELYTSFAEMLKTFIRTGCSAAVYTQTTDVELEINGLMTYDRKVIKMDEEKLRRVNRSVIETLK